MWEAIKKRGGRHAHRDATLLVIYRHGLRAEEAANLRWEQVDFATGTRHVRRVKRGTPSTQPIGGGGVAIAAAASARVSNFAVCVSVESEGATGE